MASRLILVESLVAPQTCCDSIAQRSQFLAQRDQHSCLKRSSLGVIMSARFLVIDGYNLLHAAGLARVRYGPGDLQRCREQLIQLLLKYLQPTEIARTTLVFDATQPPPDADHELYVQGLAIFFATSPGDADEFIERWLHHHHAPNHVTMVSSDHRLHRAAKRHHSMPIDSEQFLEELLRRKSSANTKPLGQKQAVDPKTTRRLNADEVDAWLAEFGDIPDADKLRKTLPGTAKVPLAAVENPIQPPLTQAGSTSAAKSPSRQPLTARPKIDSEEELLLREAENCLRQEMGED